MGCLVGCLWPLLMACRDDNTTTSAVANTPTLTLSPSPSLTPTLTPSPTATLDPFITPSATPCPINPEWEGTYEIQSGDTLGEIALAAGTTIEELAFYNCLSDLNAVYAGQILIVPNALAVEIARSPEGLAGVVVFVRQDETGQNLWTIRSDGRFPIQLTIEGDVYDRPIRAYGLDRVAYRTISPFYQATTADIPPTDLWVIEVNGTNQIRLVGQGPTDSRYRSLPTWSPNDTQLVFTEQDRNSQQGSLAWINADGTERLVLLSGNFVPPNQLEPVAPTWSPDGRSIAYLTFDTQGNASLRQWFIETRQEIVLVERFAYAGDSIYWVPLDGLGGTPAIAYQAITSTGTSWFVVNPTNRAITPRPNGLILVHRYLEWTVRPHPNGWGVYENDTLRYVIPPMPLAWITWSTEAIQFIYPTENGLAWVDMETNNELTITDTVDTAPMWSLPLWVVLP